MSRRALRAALCAIAKHRAVSVPSLRHRVAAFATESEANGEEIMRALGLSSDDFDDASQPFERVKDKAYVDRRRVRVQAGRGGGGCVSFAMDGGSRRRRGADGGDGGRGGDVVVVACEKTKALGDVKNLVRGGHGGPGGSNGRIGSRGKDAEIRVPLGTIVWKELEEEDDDDDSVEAFDVDFSKWGSESPVDHDDVEDAAEEGDSSSGKSTAGEAWTRPRGLSRGSWRMLADLTERGQTCVVARGGQGGKGNKRMPVGKEAGTREAGSDGEEAKFVLELKSVADIGLVGLPNAGKSTLLRALSNATPRVGSYAFTTMQPQLGAVSTAFGDKVTVADIPGIIKGAHENKGLGHNFLRHIERCSILVYVVDLSSADGVKPWDALVTLQRELEEYLPGLSNRRSMVVGTKSDLPNSSRTLAALRKRVNAPVFAVSAMNREGTDEIVRVLEEEMT